MLMGQWNEQMPHWTQRAASGTTHPVTIAWRRVSSDENRLLKFMIYTW
jgi:hypothetical protein